MNYQETLDWMFVQLPMYQRQGEAAYKKDLSNTLLLVNRIGNPQKNFKSIHIAGTNGKGSCSHMLASVLQEAGYKVGLYTSPHLVDFRERIKINGIEISEVKIVDFIAKNKSFFEENYLSFFEMTVGLAFEYFSEENVDFAIVEVGLGGRLDSTNIITPEVCLITNIGLDHTHLLGDTIEKIAFEKGGVIKQSIPIVIGEFQENTISVFSAIAKKMNAPLYIASELIKDCYTSDLKGSYQKLNLNSVVQVIQVLKSKGFIIAQKYIELGLSNVVKNTKLLGRWQILSKNPMTICDTAHNREGLTYTMKQLRNEKYENLYMIIGMVNDKNLDSILPLLPKQAVYCFCKPNIDRGLNAEVLREKALAFGLNGVSFNTVNQAYESVLLKASNRDCIYIGGSTFVVAEIL